MTVSEKQLRVNRQNAKKSTGPKTPEGKLKSSRNAVKHGLYSRDAVIDAPALHEDPEDYTRLIDSLTDELRPVGAFEEHMVRIIGDCIWRSRRAVRAETAEITRQLEGVERRVMTDAIVRRYMGKDDANTDPEEKERTRQNIIGALVVPRENVRLNILGYEMRLDRRLTRAYDLLASHQARRARSLSGEAAEKNKK